MGESRLGFYSSAEDDKQNTGSASILDYSAELEADFRRKEQEAIEAKINQANMFSNFWGEIQHGLRAMAPSFGSGIIMGTTHIPKIAEWERATQDDINKWYPDNDYMPKDHFDYSKSVSPHPASAKKKYKWYSRIADDQVAQNLEKYHNNYGSVIDEATTSLGIESWESIKNEPLEGWLGKSQSVKRIDWNHKVNGYLRDKFTTQFHKEQSMGKKTAVTDPNFEKKYIGKMRQIKPDYDPFAGSVGAFDKVVMPLLSIYEDEEEQIRRIKEASEHTKEGISGMVNNAGIYLHRTADESFKAYLETDDGQINKAIIDFSNNTKWTWSDVFDVRKSLMKMGQVIPSQLMIGATQIPVTALTTLATVYGGPVAGATVNTILRPAVGFLTTFSLEGGSAYGDMIEFFEDPSNEPFLISMYGKDYALMKNYIAYQTGTDVGIPNAILEFLPIWHLLGKSGASMEVRKKLIRGTLVDNQQRLFGQAIGPKSLYKAVGVTARQGLEETVTEILQTANELADFNLSELRFEPHQKVSGEMFYNQLKHSGHAGFMGGGGTGGMSSVAIDGTNQALNSYNQYDNIKKGIEIYTTDYANKIGKRGDGWHTIQMKSADGTLNSYTMNDKGLNSTYRTYLSNSNYMAWRLINSQDMTFLSNKELKDEDRELFKRNWLDRRIAWDVKDEKFWKPLVEKAFGRAPEIRSEAKENGLTDEVVTDEDTAVWTPKSKAVELATDKEDKTEVGMAIRYLLDSFESYDASKQRKQAPGLYEPTPQDKKYSKLHAMGDNLQKTIKALEILQKNNIIPNDILDNTVRNGISQRGELKKILMVALTEADLFSKSKDTRLEKNIEYVANKILEGKAKIHQQEVTLDGEETTLKPVLDLLGLKGDLAGDVTLGAISEEFSKEISSEQKEFKKQLKKEEELAEKDELIEEAQDFGKDIEVSELDANDKKLALQKGDVLRLEKIMKLLAVEIPMGRLIFKAMVGTIQVKNNAKRISLFRKGIKISKEIEDAIHSGNNSEETIKKKKFIAWSEEVQAFIIEDKVDIEQQYNKAKQDQVDKNKKTAPQNTQNEEDTSDPITEKDNKKINKDDWFKDEDSDEDIKKDYLKELEKEKKSKGKKEIKHGSRKWKQIVKGVIGDVFEKDIKSGKFTFAKKMDEFNRLTLQEQVDFIMKNSFIKGLTITMKDGDTVKGPIVPREKTLRDVLPQKLTEPFTLFGILFTVLTAGSWSARTKATGSRGTITVDFAHTQLGSGATKKHATGKYYRVPLKSILKGEEPDLNSAVVKHIIKVLTTGGTVNFAGHGIYNQDMPSQNKVDKLVYNWLSSILLDFSSPELTITRGELNGTIITGGQTGIDEAFAKASVILGLKTEVIAPRGWLYRDKGKSNISDREGFVGRFLSEKLKQNIESSKVIDKILVPIEEEAPVEGPPISSTKGVDVMRGSKWGNPFIVPEVYDKNPDYYKKQGFIRAESREDAIQSYEDWIQGTAHQGFQTEKRDAIIAGLKSGELKGKTLKYFKPNATDSHAVRLAKLVAEQEETTSEIEDTQRISELQEQEETTSEIDSLISEEQQKQIQEDVDKLWEEQERRRNEKNEKRTQDDIESSDVGDLFDDFVDKLTDVGGAVKEVVESITAKETYMVDELTHMGGKQLVEIAYKLGVKGANARWSNETLIRKILDKQGPILMGAGVGIPAFSPKQYAEFKVKMDILWKKSKLAGDSFMVFVRGFKESFIKRFGLKAYLGNVANMLSEWVNENATEGAEGVAQNLSFRLSEYNSKENRNEEKILLKELIKGAEGNTSHEVLEIDIENEHLIKEGTNHFSAWHSHTLIKKRFLKMFGGLIDDKTYQFYQAIAQKYDNNSSFRFLEAIGLIDKNQKSLKDITDEFGVTIDWVEEGAFLDQDRFIRDMYDHMNFNKKLEENETNTNALKLFWLSNQIENMMPLKEVNKSIIDTTRDTPKIVPRPDKLHNVTDPDGVMPDFINHEESDLGLIYSSLSAGDIVKQVKGQDGSTYWVDGRAKLTPEWLWGEHIRLGKGEERQFSIVGIKSTTGNPQIIIAEVTALDFTRADNFEQYMKEELEAGNLLPIDVANYTVWFNRWQQAPEVQKPFKRVQLAQELAVHRTMQLMRYNKYATQMYSHSDKVPSISNIFKRLKGDATKGMVPVGLGDIKVMQVDVQNIILQNSETNEIIDALFEGNSAWDGQLLSSTDVISRIGNIIGDPKLTEIKPYIRHRSEDGENYINIKSEASIPGSFIIREKNADGSMGRIIAEVKTVYTDEGIWEARIVDSLGNPIDFLGTQEEIKNALGEYDNLNNIINLPESALRIISTDKHVNYEAPFPTIWLDALSSPQDQEIRQILTDYIVKQTIDSYVHDENGKGMFQVFGDVRNTDLLRKIMLGLEAEDSMPQQLGLYMRYLQSGFGHSVFTDELKFVIKNRVIIDKVFRGSLAYGGTNATLSGDHSREVGLDEFHIGVKNSWAFDLAINAYKKQYGKEKAIVSLKVLNDWLAEGHVKVLAFRHPLNGKTEVRMKKLTKLLPSHRGNIIVQNPEDTFKINVADHDGDHGMLVVLPDDLAKILETYMNREGEYAQSHRETDLDIFAQHGVELDEEGNPILARISNVQQRFNSVSAVADFYKTIGAIINFKRIRGILAIKGISKFTLAKMGKDGSESEIELIQPDDKVVMSYAKLDKNQRDKIDPKDRIMQNEGGDLFLETTSEQEFTLLANASTDNPDRMLLMDWGYEGRRWLVQRIFKRTDGKELTKHQITALLFLVDKFNYSRKLKGNDKFGGKQHLHQIMNTSTTIHNSLIGTPKDQSDRLVASINESIRKGKTNYKVKWYIKPDSLNVNGQHIATERLLASLKDKHDEYYENNPQPRGGNKPPKPGGVARTWVQLNPALEGLANHESAEVLQSKISEYVKKYDITDEDATAGLAFLLKFVNGHKRWYDNPGEYRYFKFKKDENGKDLLDDKGNRVPEKAGFYHIFDSLDNDRKNLKEVNKSGINLSGYNYQEGMNQLFEDFIEEWEALSEGAQASFIYGWFTGANVRKTKIQGKTVLGPLRKPSNLKKMLPFQFNVVSSYNTDGSLNIDATIINDFFNAFEANSKHEAFKKDWRNRLKKIEKATFTSITEVTCKI